MRVHSFCYLSLFTGSAPCQRSIPPVCLLPHIKDISVELLTFFCKQSGIVKLLQRFQNRVLRRFFGIVPAAMSSEVTDVEGFETTGRRAHGCIHRLVGIHISEGQPRVGLNQFESSLGGKAPERQRENNDKYDSFHIAKYKDAKKLPENDF